MVNAVRLAAMFVDRLPKRHMRPETTADREDSFTRCRSKAVLAR